MRGVNRSPRQGRKHKPFPLMGKGWDGVWPLTWRAWRGSAPTPTGAPPSRFLPAPHPRPFPIEGKGGHTWSWLIVIGVLSLLTSSAAHAAPPIPTQLPTGVEPVSYDLAITPDAAKLSFTGHVAIAAEVSRATPAITLNAVDLTLANAAIDGQPATATTDPKTQTATS